MEEKKELRQFVICFVATVLTFAVLFGGFIVVVDPFYHYHDPYFNIPVILENAVYQTAGAAKNLEYDSAIVGTSMTENMHTSWFDEELGWKTMKLSYSGARSNDLKAIYEQIAQKEGTLAHVVTDINTYQLTSESWTSYVERPHYLYDEYLYNDGQYVYNHDVLLVSIRRSLDGLLGVQDNIDTAYTWEDEELFGRDVTLRASEDVRNSLIGGRAKDALLYEVTGSTSVSLEEKIKTCQENLDNVLPFMAAHPETEFWVMIPPYSMLYWEQEILKGELEDMIAIYAYAIKSLLVYDNVKVFYFQNEPEIITNLDNYRDSAHHTPRYNRYMFECMKEGKNLLTYENYKQKLEAMYRFARDFDYESLWAE